MRGKLFVFAGLPGTGKTSLSHRLAERLPAAHLRIDTIEQGLRDCGFPVEGEGYYLAHSIAKDNLRLGVAVVADCCNPWEITRSDWEDVAREGRSECIHIEVLCSDAGEHRRRIETRVCTVPGLVPPTWEDVLNRDYQSWTRDRIVIETAGRSELECFDEAPAHGVS